MPFGLKNAPIVFQRLMAKIKNLTESDDMLHYMDDILIGAQTADELLQKMKRVFDALRTAGLTLNPKKCIFAAKTLPFLGHQLTPNGIQPGEIKTLAIRDFKRPTTVTDLRRFLGLSGYFRKCVPNYAIISEPIRQLLRKDAKFRWSESQEKAFNDLKSCLTKMPVLIAFDQDADHQLHTDASSHGLAAVLMQKSNDCWKPVAFYSRSMSDTENKMHSYELETLAVVEGLERFRYYIYGKTITVVTDCSAVKNTMTKRNLIPRIARWWLRIQDYAINIEHRSEQRMTHVDALSRVEVSRNAKPASLRVLKANIDDSDWLYSMQLQDSKLKEIIDKLKQNDKQIKKEFVIEHGRLYKRVNEQKL